MPSRRKKKFKKLISGHLISTKQDGSPMFANDQEKKDFLKSVKDRTISEQQLLDILKDPDNDTFLEEQDSFRFDARENKDTDGDGIGDNLDIILTKVRLDDIMILKGIHFDENAPAGEELKVQDFTSNVEFYPFVDVDNPTYMGGLGFTAATLIATSEALNAIKLLGTPQQRWNALNAARDGNQQYPLDDDGDLPGVQTISKEFFFRDYICYVRSLEDSPWNPSVDTVNKFNKLKSELLAMTPDNIGDISYPDIKLSEILQDVASSSYTEHLPSTFSWANVPNMEKWLDGYTEQGAVELIYDTVTNTDYDTVINQVLNLIPIIFNDIRQLDEEAIAQGLVTEETLEYSLDWEGFGLDVPSRECL